MDPWVRDYQTRRWETYGVAFRDLPPTKSVQNEELRVCSSDSQLARKLEYSPRRFYWDWECVAAGIDPTFGGKLTRLREAWRGHSAGSLVMKVYTGADKEPPTMTIAVEVAR